MDYDPTQTDFASAETSTNARGIVFDMTSRRRFISYGWLLFVEMNADAIEIQFHYTHCIVVVTGRSLQSLHDWASESILAIVQESSLPAFAGRPVIQRIEISEASVP